MDDAEYRDILDAVTRGMDLGNATARALLTAYEEECCRTETIEANLAACKKYHSHTHRDCQSLESALQAEKAAHAELRAAFEYCGSKGMIDDFLTTYRESREDGT